MANLQLNDPLDIDGPFSAHMTMEEANNLRVGDLIDHKDITGMFVKALITAKVSSYLWIHYPGFDNKWDIWSDFKQELHKFSKYRSISQRPRHRFYDLSVGDYIDIKPTYSNSWLYGSIIRIDDQSGQIQVSFIDNNDKSHLYFTHIDNENECAKYQTKSLIINNMNEIKDDNKSDKLIEKNGNGNDDWNILTDSSDSSHFIIGQKQSDYKIDVDVDVKKKKNKKFNYKTRIIINKTKKMSLNNPNNVSLWNNYEIIKWLNRIDNGKLKNYKYSHFRKQIKKSKLRGNDLLNINQTTLKLMNINDINDRKLILGYIADLFQNNKKQNDINQCNNNNVSSEIPDCYCDPITYEIMDDPVIVMRSGHTYERKFIEEYIKYNKKDPITQQYVEIKDIISNRALRDGINMWKMNNYA